MPLPRPIRWITSCFPFFFLILLISELCVGLAPAQAQPKVLAAAAPEHVLLLYTYGDGLPGYQKATPAFLSVMTAGGININDLFFEYLDLQRNNNAEYRRKLADLLRYKYATHQVKLIVTVHTGALNFLLDEAKGLFPDVPIFSYLIVRPELIEAKNTGRRILLRPQNLDMRGTLEIALKMFPETRKIVFVTGTASGDRNLEHEAKRAFEPWRDKLEFQYTSDRSLEEILQLVASLPPRSIVIYNNVFSDKTGRTFTPLEVGKMVAKAANAPVFCLWDTLIGNGPIGGSLLSFEAEGAFAANMVLSILNGKVLLTKPVTTLTTSKTFMFDSRQLKRWGVNENTLPEGSIVVNREVTLWSIRYYILGILAFCIMETALIIIMIAQRRRKEVAQASLRQRTEELDQFFNVTLDLLCIANTDGYFLRLNPAWEKILGYTREELVAKRFLEFVHPDDLDRTREAVSTLVSQQKVFSFENRYRCKDGTYRWLQWSSAPAGNLIYAAARDITERKRAEEEAVQHVKNIEYLSETAMGFVELPAEKDIYWFIGEKLRQLTGDAIYVSVNAYDQKTRRIEARALLADDQDLRGILETLGTDLRGMSFSLSEEAWNGLISGKLVRVPGGIYELFFGELPKAACDALEKLAGIGEIFAMGFASKGELYGNAIIIMREGSQLSGKDVIEAFLRQAGVALQRKLADEALKKSEERFRMLIETMNEGFGVQNENGIWTYANDQLCWMLGHLPGEVIGHPVTEFLDEANQSVLREEIQKQREGNYSPYEMTWTRIDGRKVTTKVSPKPIFNPQGRLKEAFAVITDITERKQGEEILKQSEERFRQVAENVGDFIWEVDTNGLYLYTSPSVEKILGYRPDELVGKRHFYDLFAPEVREELKAAAFKVFAAKGSFRALPNSNIGKEGKVVHLETSGAPVVDAAGNLVGYRGADTDVTERKKTEEELRRHQEHLEELVRERAAELIMARDQAEDANRAKSTFLANMSHELRTPLNSILGIAQLMERDPGFPGRHRDILKILSRSGAHLLELINDVLEMSKIEAGKMVPVITSFDLRSFLGDLEEMIRLRADQKGLKLLFEHKSPLPQYIETDVRKLRQTLVNLLGNAIKYTGKGGVTLRIAFKKGMDTTAVAKPASMARLEFEIEDTGIGIAPEDTQRIFEPFVQVNPGRSARDGTGLGLTLSRMFVELLGGEITIRSQVGRGSIFAFDIPAKLAEGAAIHTEVSDRQVIGLIPGQSPYLLLVVDDSVENRFVLRRLLEQGGFSVLEAASGQEAVDLFKDRQPHLIWMDLRMPGMDGDEAARRIREAENGRGEEKGKEIHTPIIALTAGIMEYEGPPAHSQVFDDWVYKPYRETEIFAKLEKHLGVQFIYRPPVESVSEADKGLEKDALTPADLAVLPMEWLQKFSQTLRRGGSEELLNLIDRIRSEHTDLARALAELVHIYRFDKLIAVTGEVLKENSSG